MSDEPCCCGKKRIHRDETAVIFNDYQHERVGPGQFCGPKIHHELRDARAEIERLRDLLNEDE